MSKEAGVRCANVFHAGDGNLHPLILFDGREPGALERAEALAGRILRMCIEMGGSITGEHGIGMEKRQYLSEMFSVEEIDCMKRVRAAFDPLGISNPGKMFPEAEAPRTQTITMRSFWLVFGRLKNSFNFLTSRMIFSSCDGCWKKAGSGTR